MDQDILPQHVAIIMDGNGRWAQKRHLPRTRGHIEGGKRVEEIVGAARKKGIKVLTLYTFSTENWNRPQSEVSMLMRMLTSLLNKKITELSHNGIRVQFIGKEEGIPPAVREVIHRATQLTKNNTDMILNMAFNYGGRQEIVEAIQRIAASLKNNTLKISDIDEELIDRSLYTKGLPDPDLLIRTSGEKRISNFLLWQSSYAEFYFTDKLWPDFDTAEFEKALMDFQTRQRRYGGISPVGG